MENIIIAVLGALFFGIVGYLGVLKAKYIQMFFLEYYNKHKIFNEFHPFLKWMKSNQYVLSIKFVGILGMIGFVFLLFCIIMMVIDII